MNYSYEYQNEIHSVFFSRQSVMHYTATLTYKLVCKTYLIVSISHDKAKDTVVVFVDFLYNHFDDPEAIHGII